MWQSHFHQELLYFTILEPRFQNSQLLKTSCHICAHMKWCHISVSFHFVALSLITFYCTYMSASYLLAKHVYLYLCTHFYLYIIYLCIIFISRLYPHPSHHLTVNCLHFFFNRVSYSFSTTNNSFTKMTRWRCWALTWAMASPLPSRRTAWNGYRMTCALDKWWCSSSIYMFIDYTSRYVLQMAFPDFFGIWETCFCASLGLPNCWLKSSPLLKDFLMWLADSTHHNPVQLIYSNWVQTTNYTLVN